MRKRGILITFEGAEGSGKSTQIRSAASFFRKKGRRVLLIREPGGTRVSEAVRNVLLDAKHKGMSKEAELLLYLAARAQLVREKILPALKEGKVVISDRFEDSTVVYQGCGDGIPLGTIEQLSRFARGSLKPDLTIVLDVNPKEGFKRGGRHDRVEKKSDAFHRRVRQGFLSLARRNRRMVVIQTSRPKEEVRRRVLEILKERLG